MRRYTPLVGLVALVLIGYGLYALWLLFEYRSIWFLLWVVPSIAAGIGIAMSRAWSQYLLYFIAFCTVAGWAATGVGANICVDWV